ncbi:hypothetical protein T310_8458, partial [Rasamsonia emersonii CBS 393.64]
GADERASRACISDRAFVYIVFGPTVLASCIGGAFRLNAREPDKMADGISLATPAAGDAMSPPVSSRLQFFISTGMRPATPGGGRAYLPASGAQPAPAPA